MYYYYYQSVCFDTKFILTVIFVTQTKETFESYLPENTKKIISFYDTKKHYKTNAAKRINFSNRNQRCTKNSCWGCRKRIKRIGLYRADQKVHHVNVYALLNSRPKFEVIYIKGFMEGRIMKKLLQRKLRFPSLL